MKKHLYIETPLLARSLLSHLQDIVPHHAKGLAQVPESLQVKPFAGNQSHQPCHTNSATLFQALELALTASSCPAQLCTQKRLLSIQRANDAQGA